MNLERIIRVTNCYLFLTGYQIHWYDRKSLHYRLAVSGFLYFLLMYIFYFICFCHNFESSSFLKILLDISPFLHDLLRLQVILGLKVFIFGITQTKNVTKVSNSLVRLFNEEIKSQKTFDISEVLVYLMFFSTLFVTIIVGFYIAIELKFEMPSLDQLMIHGALFIPHFALAGCLRLNNLCLWLMKREFFAMQRIFKQQESETIFGMLKYNVVVEICNPVSETNARNATSQEIYQKISKRIDLAAECLNLVDSILQRHLSILVGMNFNCLLAGFYSLVYFETTWKILFANKNRRVFYAANSAIYICIILDYAMLLFTRCRFCRAKQNLYDMIEAKLIGNEQIEAEIKTVLKSVIYKLSKKFTLNLFGLVEFNTWNFFVLKILMMLIISLVISHQYFHDQIRTLTERLDANGSE